MATASTAITEPPLIPDLPTPTPDRFGGAAFDGQMQAWLASFPGWTSGANELATWLRSTAELAEAAAAAASTSASNAATTAGGIGEATSEAAAAAQTARTGAVDAAAVAVAKATIATDQAALAQEKVVIATTQADTATVQAAAAAAAKAAAELARDAALIQGGVYVDEPTGRAAVADGVAFKVQGAGEIAAYEYRRVNSGTVSTLIAVYPSKAAVDGVRSDFLVTGKNRVLNATFQKDALAPLASFTGPIGYTISKSGIAGAAYPQAAIVEKAVPLIRSNRVLELIHDRTATTLTDFQLLQPVDIPREFWGDTSIVARVLVVAQHEVAGITLAALGTMFSASNVDLGASTVTKLTADGTLGTWFTAAFDVPVTNATARKLRINVRSQMATGAALTGKALIAGVFCDFARPSQFGFDANKDELLSDALAAMKRDYHLIGRNKYTNPLFASDAIGLSTPPAGYAVVVPSAPTAVAAPYSIVDKRHPEILQSYKAVESTHAFDGTNNTDFQLGQVIDIPSDLIGDVTTKIRVVFHYFREHANIEIESLVEMYNSAGGSLSATPGVKISADVSIGNWGVAVFDVTIVNAAARRVRVVARAFASKTKGVFSGGKIQMTGLFCDFNRPDQFCYDSNLAMEVDAIKASDSQLAPWKLGTNPVKNPLLTTDAVGTAGAPSGYGISAGGANAVAATERGIVAAITPFGTDRAFSAKFLFDGTLHSDSQLFQELDVPAQHWGDTTLKARFIYYVNSTDLRINQGAFFQTYNAAGVVINAPTVTKVSTDGPVNTWFPVIFDVVLSSPLIRKVRFSTRQSALRTAGNFSGATCLTTALFAGFNRMGQTTFDRSYADESDQIAKKRVDALRVELANATPRSLVGAFDQYCDGRGNVLPMLPTAVINTFGDSLTAANYAARVQALFAAAGSTRTVKNCGIGSDTSVNILARVKGHDVVTAGLVFTPGQTTRLKTRRAVPARTIDETYRAQWATFGATIAEPKKVEFFNAAGLIGSSRDQIKAAATVSGAVFTSNGHPFANGDEVYHLGESLPTGLAASKTYFVRDVGANNYSLAEFSAGPAVSFGSGSVTALGGFYFDWAYTTGQNTTLSAITHTDKDMDTAVLWMGANNIIQTQQVKNDIRAAFEHIKTMAKRVLVMTVLPNQSYLPATAEGISLANVNTWILAEFPNNSVDALGYLKSKYNPALPQDVTDVANNITPTSLRIDAIHLTSAGDRHIADLVFAFFSNRGW